MNLKKMCSSGVIALALLLAVLLAGCNGSNSKFDTNLTTDTLTINRGLSGGNFSSTSFSQAVTEERPDGKVVLHIYVDRCSLEAFSGNYTAAGAMLIFPEEQDTGATLYAEGGACDFEVTITQANSIWTIP